jgi:hypothetical protein
MLIFCIQNKKKFSAKKCLYLIENLFEPVKGKKIVNFGENKIFVMQSTHNGEHIKNSKKNF